MGDLDRAGRGVLFEATDYVLPPVSRCGRSIFLIVTVASSAIALAGCKSLDEAFCSGGGCEWSAEEWQRVQTLSPLQAPPPDRSNRYWDNPDAIALGQEFYFDTRFSGKATVVDSLGVPVPRARAVRDQPIDVSCATCHDPRRAGSDLTSRNPVSIGAGWYDVNGQQTLNAAHYPLLYWNGRSDSLWSQAAAVSESGVSVNGTRLQTFRVIVDDPHYRAAYEALFGADYPLPAAPVSTTDFPPAGKPGQAPFDGLSDDDKMRVTRVWVNWAKAIGAYEYTLVSRDAAFDVFVQQGAGSTAISPAAKRGARLFVGKASCIDCHSGPLLSDGLFHDISVPQLGDHVPTVADCLSNTRCDCTPGEEKSTCLPSGAWGGLLRLAASNDSAGFNYNNLRRDSTWSDDTSDTSRASYYDPPTDNALKGAWRTPSLRDVALTPPYMHNGYYLTLEDVVWHYNVGGTASGSGQFAKTPERAVQIKPLGLSDSEQADLVEFLKTLTGAPLDDSKTTKPPVADAGAQPDAGSPPDAGASDAALP